MKITACDVVHVLYIVAFDDPRCNFIYERYHDIEDRHDVGDAMKPKVKISRG